MVKKCGGANTRTAMSIEIAWQAKRSSTKALVRSQELTREVYCDGGAQTHGGGWALINDNGGGRAHGDSPWQRKAEMEPGIRLWGA